MVGFTLNASGEVFAGPRSRAAGSGIVLMLRNGSELTVCEHGASEPSSVTTAFSPDGRSLFFDSDRDGERAVYRLSVEDLVEPTAR
jgi:Tol biopolymer transport system component